MQLLHWLSVLVFGLLVSAQQSPLQKELEIKTTYSPSDCNAKAKKGDAIKVHYVRSLRRLPHASWLACSVCVVLAKASQSSLWQTGKLLSNGNKFDSRYDSRLTYSFCARADERNTPDSYDRSQPLPLTRAA
jgi:hypothetical protein